ncbi:MAG: acyl-CoA dehydrogenase C-terminal domain-containing protein [Deltaproteobacteria bacterium]|nr:acyl-CoA dehydrogenase C-terminal domain-containing protein [Deltaproteobacteria bacterium]
MEFKYDVRDLQFILKEWLPTEEVLNCDRFKENYSIDDVDMFLNEGYKVAREVVNPINAEGDKTGAKLENGIVTPAPGYKDAFRFLQENGWGSSSECIEMDGGMPLIMYKAIFEMNQAACPALLSYIKLTSGAANLIIRFGTEKEKDLILPKMLSGEWQGTMCLTEPNAGSDVGDSMARAYPTDDPRIWKVKGTKMFITAGDAGLCENTIHMVLARPEGGAPGSQGLGLYLVPKIWVNDDGSLGRENDVTTVSLEHKMGLKAQATTMLNFGDNDECYGIMMGSPPDEKGRSKGLPMMFHMMNESRIGTGHNANTQAAAAYYFATQYAIERIQGRPFGERLGDRVPIIKHEDIRRMLLDMKAHVEGIRAMTFKGFYYLDIQANSNDKEKAKQYGEIAEVLTPLVKCYGSEASLNVIAEAIQILGGVGYTQEYPVEQYLRDSKVLTIWEGTSYIHGNDLVGRKMRMKDGLPFTNWFAVIKDFVTENKNASGFEREMAKLAKGCECVEEVKKIYDYWYENFSENKGLIPLYSIKALFVSAQLQVAQCLMEQALIANERLEELPEGAYEGTFYEGKVASARYYLNNVLPHAFTLTDLIREADTAVLECPEEALVIK